MEAKYTDRDINARVSIIETQMWEIDTQVLSSILTLWLFSLELRRSTSIQAMNDLRKVDMDINMAQLDNRRNVYLRIVAPSCGAGGGKMSCDDLETWLDVVVSQLPIFSPDATPNLDAFDVSWGNREIDELLRKSNFWVLWGTNLSAYFK